MLAVKEWRGSVESVTGMPSRVPWAISWTALCHSAIRRGSAVPTRLKWLRPWSLIRPVVSAGKSLSSPSSTGRPSACIGSMVWNIRPAFSCGVIRPSRSSTRSSTGRAGSW
ncbi:hypothetical protein GCM10010195_49560 [Kitasatospora griseola]|nr:hypothetical protein GCM10010195_49560 [Kitasatospora griseola]